jgi:hypothetical protein
MGGDFLTLEWISLALSMPILYAAWYEYSERNTRDAKLLAGLGAGGLIVTGAAFML